MNFLSYNIDLFFLPKYQFMDKKIISKNFKVDLILIGKSLII